MATFDELVAKSVEDGSIPGVVLMAKDKDGTPLSPTDMLIFSESAGHAYLIGRRRADSMVKGSWSTARRRDIGPWTRTTRSRCNWTRS